MADRDLVAPPPRYRVEERGGQLVVIDRGAGTNETRTAPTAPRSAAAGRGKRFERTSFDGRGVLTTRRWYDDKGPRRLAVDSGTGQVARWAPIAAVALTLTLAAAMILFPWALVVIPILAQPKPWKNARERITAHLDKFPAVAG